MCFRHCSVRERRRKITGRENRVNDREFAKRVGANFKRRSVKELSCQRAEDDRVRIIPRAILLICREFEMRGRTREKERERERKRDSQRKETRKWKKRESSEG